MAKQSKIEIALETIGALRDRYRLEYIAGLNRWNDGELTEEVETKITWNKTAERICQQIIFIIEDIEANGK